MRTITKEFKVYKFEELSETAQQSAIDKNYSINIDHDWWCYVYEEIEELGGTCEGFDIDRGPQIDLKINDYEAFASKIIVEHGTECETYKTAKKFLDDIKESDNDDDIKSLNEEFLHAIGQDYLIMLRNEYEYLTTEESIHGTIEANDYEFLENGDIYQTSGGDTEVIKKKNKIIVYLSRGVVQNVDNPTSIDVIVNDYDIDDGDENHRDHEGIPCYSCVY